MKICISNVFIILFICINPVFSQTVLSGKVIAVKGDPIGYATIITLNAKKNIVSSTASKADGNFNVTTDSSSVYICATYLTERSDTIMIDKRASIVLTLAPNGKTLEEVQIQGTVQMISRKADRFIFTPNRYITEGAAAIDIVKLAPFIQFDNKSEVFSILNKENTIIYINNRKSNVPKEMIMAQLRSMPAENIKDIEIITNPGSEYQANATGGIININLKRLVNEGWSGSLMISDEQGVYNTAALNGSVNYREGKIGIRLSPFINNSYNYNTSQNLIKQKEDGISQNNDKSYFRRYLVLGGGLGFDYDIDEKNLLSFNGFASSVGGNSNQNNRTDYRSPVVEKLDSSFLSLVDGKDRYLYNFGNLYFQHKFDSLGKKQLTINIDYNQYHQTNTDLGQFIKSSGNQGLESASFYRNVLPQKFINFSEGIDYATEINTKTRFNLGGQISNTRMLNDLSYANFIDSKNEYVRNQNISNNYKYTENYTAFYAGFTRTISKRLQGVIGLRGEYINYSARNESKSQSADSSYFSLFPNLSLQYSLNKRNSFSVSFAKKIKRPAIELLFPGRTYFNPGYFSENNPFLQPVNTYSTDLMYIFDSKYYFSVGYSYSQNQYSRFITPFYNGESTLLKRTYLNYGNSSNLYLSFFTAQKFFKGIWEVNLSAVLNRNCYQFENNSIASTRKNLNNLNYSFSTNSTLYFSKKKMWLGFVTMKYLGPTQDISVRRDNGLFSADIGVRKSLNNLSFALFLTDIFNTNAKSNLLYQSNDAFLSNIINQNTYTRSVSLSLRYSFGNNKLKTIKNKNTANEELKKRLN